MLFHYILSICLAAIGAVFTILGFAKFVASQQNQLWFVVLLAGLATLGYFGDRAKGYRDQMKMF